jgi:hypothetical protein
MLNHPTHGLVFGNAIDISIYLKNIKKKYQKHFLGGNNLT